MKETCPTSLRTLLPRLTEEGENTDVYRAIAEGDVTAPLHHLCMTYQDATRSQLGDYYEIHARTGLICLLQGQVTILLDGRPHTVSAGQYIIHYPFQTHFFLKESPDTLILAIVFEAKEEDIFASRLKNRVHNIPAGGYTRLETIIRDYLHHRAKESCATIYDFLSQTHIPIVANDTRPDWQRRLDHIPDHPDYICMRTKEIAALLNITPNHLASYYKEHYNVPLGTYMEHRRFGEALRQLSLKDSVIADVASATGFRSVSSFVRKMRTWCGMPPGECRRVLLSPYPQIRFTPFGQTIHRNV